MSQRHDLCNAFGCEPTEPLVRDEQLTIRGTFEESGFQLFREYAVYQMHVFSLGGMPERFNSAYACENTSLPYQIHLTSRR